jgi:hypothetical protein
VTALLSPKVWIAIALAGVLAFSHFFVYRAGKAQVRTAWDEQKLVDAEAWRKAEAASREREQSLQTQANETNKVKDAKIRKITAARDDAIERLRNRPERPADFVPEAPGTARGATGAGLFRGDSEFLVRLGSSADAIAAERDACYRQYEQIRAAAGP